MKNKQKLQFVAGWTCGGFIIFAGMIYLIPSPISGVFFLIAGLILLPPLSMKIKSKFDYKTWQKCLAVAICLTLAVIFTPKF
jgi:hypothetical protein